MVRSKILQGKVLALASMMCLMAGIVSAQEPDETGIVHITDISSVAIQHGILRTNCDKAAACGVGGACENGVCGQGNCRNCQNGGNACRSCQSGYGGCRTCNFGGGLGGLCPLGGANCNGCGSCNAKLSMSMRRIMAWIDPCSGVCMYSPTHGFVPPSKRPYFRQPVSYQHNYPANWVGGTPSGSRRHHAAVYTPTDTTQLGYYYQKVPTWVPVPGFIPPAPHPSQWHQYGPTAVAAYNTSCPTPSVEQGSPIEVIKPDDTEIAPAPPKPEAAKDNADLERSVSNPNLLPIVR